MNEAYFMADYFSYSYCFDSVRLVNSGSRFLVMNYLSLARDFYVKVVVF